MKHCSVLVKRKNGYGFCALGKTIQVGSLYFCPIHEKTHANREVLLSSHSDKARMRRHGTALYYALKKAEWYLRVPEEDKIVEMTEAVLHDCQMALNKVDTIISEEEEGW